MINKKYTTILEKSFEIIVGDNIIKHLPSICNVKKHEKVVIITDETVKKLHLSKLTNVLSKLDKKPFIITIRPGENSKKLSQISNIYKSLLENHVDKNDVLISLGGGVVSDITGFAASSYMRGIDWIAIPTTLLSQVDAAIGGKTGVNFQSIKNVVGAINHPTTIICDVSLLNTLPAKEFISGLAEVIKYAITLDPSLFTLLEKKNNRQLLPKELVSLVQRCIDLKISIVSKDEFDINGKRAVLNFGHTAGHAIEAIECRKLTHGESIALGIITACKISEIRKNFPSSETQRVISLLKKYKLPTTWKGNIVKVVNKINHDKKKKSGVVKWVLLSDFGKPNTNCAVDVKLVKTVLRKINI